MATLTTTATYANGVLLPKVKPDTDPEEVIVTFVLPRARDTRSLPIGGGGGYPRSPEELVRQIESLSAWTGVSGERVKVLFERYGTRAEAIATFLNDGIDFPVQSLPDYSFREISYLAQHEKIIHLDDFLLRRSKLAMLGRLTRRMVEELAGVLGDVLDWDADRRNAEARRTLSILAERHGVHL